MNLYDTEIIWQKGAKTIFSVLISTHTKKMLLYLDLIKV